MEWRESVIRRVANTSGSEITVQVSVICRCRQMWMEESKVIRMIMIWCLKATPSHPDFVFILLSYCLLPCPLYIFCPLESLSPCQAFPAPFIRLKPLTTFPPTHSVWKTACLPMSSKLNNCHKIIIELCSFFSSPSTIMCPMNIQWMWI